MNYVFFSFLEKGLLIVSYRMEEKTRIIRIFLQYKNQYFVAVFQIDRYGLQKMFQTILYLNNDNCQTSSLQKKSFFFWFLQQERIRYPKYTEIRVLEMSQKIVSKASLQRFFIFFGKFLSYLNNVFHSGVKVWQKQRKTLFN